MADQDLKRNTQQIWQSLCVLALLTKHNETAIFIDFTSLNDSTPKQELSQVTSIPETIKAPT
ncbi:MAG: hypothetical protein QE487_12570 [Fluviicola sp.]|nr:hypothetical protein [Fluviicola sp.]